MNFIKLKEWRQRHQLTQLQMSELVGVNQSQISRWERNKQTIPKWLDKLMECWEEKNNCSFFKINPALACRYVCTLSGEPTDVKWCVGDPEKCLIKMRKENNENLTYTE